MLILQLYQILITFDKYYHVAQFFETLILMHFGPKISEEILLFTSAQSTSEVVLAPRLSENAIVSF